MSPRFARSGVLALALAASSCHRGADSSTSSSTGSGRDPSPSVSADAGPDLTAAASAEAAPHPDEPTLGITAFVTTVYKEPRSTSSKLGYLRVGAKIARSAEPAGTSGCPGGWYEIKPRGFVCIGKDATLDMDAPILEAAARRPNLKAALPYHYGFVRSVLPLYLRVPTEKEQYKSEFKLKEHLEWFDQNKDEITKVSLGANDVPIDERGVPIPNKRIGELGLAKNSTEQGIGVLLGGQSDDDPIPFWLADGKRAIPNISDFIVPEYAVFADRARRHTGLSVIGSFVPGPDALERRMAITTDLRLAPESKLKPDTGSPYHGVELSDELTLPLAFVRSQGTSRYKIVRGQVVPEGTVDYRSVQALSGTMRRIGGVKYYRTRDKYWLHQLDVGLAIAPATWPAAAESGAKWIEVSLGSQTLVLWEGKRPIYATLISSGRAGIDNPKKTTATVMGTFKIKNKHITATMDSNESSAVGGKAATSARGDSGQSRSKGRSSDKAKSGEEKVPTKGDGEYGVTTRRGQGTFVLRDVPYIQYFEAGYALHTAYWHDVFGVPRSHGCINLSPIDAHRIFLWTDPPVPEGWHAVNAGGEMGDGTTVVIHE